MKQKFNHFCSPDINNTGDKSVLTILRETSMQKSELLISPVKLATIPMDSFANDGELLRTYDSLKDV